MAKRRVNKNLVAFLTAAGIIAAVVVVAIATINAAQRDPRAIADKAAAQEKVGDLERAVDLYRRAYSIGKDATYLIEAARCAREMGEFAEMFTLLTYAYAQAPHDAAVLEALLTRYWELRDYPVYKPWEDILEYAENLLELQNDNLLALVSKSVALEQLKDEDPSYATESNAALSHAAEIDPTSPYVALVRSQRTRARATERARELRQAGRRRDAEQVLEEARAERVGILEPAVAAHPGEVALIIALSQALLEREQWEASRQCLEAGLAQQPDNPELHYEMARFLYGEALRKDQAASAEEVSTLVSKGLRQVDRVLQLDAALYRAYSLRAQLQRLGWIKNGRWETELRQCQKEILEGLETALRETVGLRTKRAVLGAAERLQLIARAFDVALGFYRTERDPELRSQAKTYARRFLQEGQTQYPEHALVSLMRGHVALLDGDDRLAIKAFRDAEQRGEGLGFGRLAKEELIRVYRKVAEFGLSLRYTDEVIQLYEDGRLTPPRWLWLHKAEVLAALDRPQEALDLLDSIAATYPDDTASKAIRGRVLALLGRAEEATQMLQELGPENPRLLVDRARIAAFNEDYDTAAKLLREALRLRPDNLPTIRLLMQVLLAADRRDEAAQIVQERIQTTADERRRRTLQSYHVMLSERDPEQRKQKLLKIISQIPDELERAAQYFNYWVSQGELERAVTYLDEMEALQEGQDAAEVLRLQFNLAMRLGKCQRAEKYISRLARMNADRAGGAMFRGRYELGCGDPQAALSEFRAVEREFPTDSSLKVRIAQALLLLQPPRYDEAMQTLEQAIEFDPRSFAALKLLYACYEQTGRRQEGMPYLERAEKINPGDPFIKERAQILEEEKDPRKGIARREPLREQNPDDLANLLRLAELYTRIGELELAEERLQAALQVDASDRTLARFGANFYARRGDRDGGEQLLYRHLAAQEGLGKVIARVLLGRFYEMLGDQAAALDMYQQARASVDEVLPADSDDRRRGIVVTASELAAFYRRTRAYPEMIDAQRVVLSHLEPTEVASIQAARRTIIQGLMMLRQYGEAEKEVGEYRKRFPDDPRGLMLEAEVLLARHRVDEARATLTRVLELRPDSAWARYMRGRINIEQGRYREARGDLLRAKTVAPRGFNLNHRLDLARLYEITGEFGLAEAELRELLGLPRADRTVELRLIDLLRNSGQVAKAQEFVNELITREPDQPFWHYQLGRLLMAREEYSAAVRPLSKAVELTEGAAPDVVADLLLALTRGNRAGEATQAYESLDPEEITPAIQAYAAEAYLAENQPQVAIALLEQAVYAGGLRGVASVRFVVSRAVDILGRDKGLGVLRRVLENASNNPNAEMALRSTLAGYLVTDADAARRAEGLELTKEVISAVPEGVPLHIEALLVQAQAFDQTGEPEQAVQTYETVLRLDPDNRQALNNLAYMLVDKLDRPSEALQYAERLYDLAPGNPSALDTVGWVYFKNGKVELAEGVLREALRVEPDALAARYHLGQLYADRGQRPAAQRTFRRLLEKASEQENGEYKKKAEEALAKLR